MGLRGIFRQLKEWKNPIIVLLLPIILLPLPLQGESPVARCAYAVLIIGTYWVLEVMPIAVTSLIPMFLFPLLGIMPAGDVCSLYANDTLMLFLGSLVVAVAVERWGLHKRIALRALTLVGPEPRWLMLGIMLPTWFLSMWMSNTATTAMMIPILNAILIQIKEIRQKVKQAEEEEAEDSNGVVPNGVAGHKKDVSITFEMDDIMDPDTPLRTKESEMQIENRCRTERINHEKDNEFSQLAKTFALCTAYAANAGGIATLTGTPPNIIFKGQADIIFKDVNADSGVNFANWMVAGVPLSIVVFLFTWIWMQIYCLRSKCLCCVKQKESYEMVKLHLKNEYRRLGRMSFAEWVVLLDFVVLALLWITRNPQFIAGWGSLFPKNYVKDSTAAIFMSVLLFVLPSQPPRIFSRPQPHTAMDYASTEQVIRKDQLEMRDYIPLLNWKVVNEKMAWGVLLLMGGGFALAEGCSRSGLSSWLCDKFVGIGHLEPWIIASMLSYLVAIVTNITSNAATATLFLPIVGELAVKLDINPLYFMIPCAVSASFAYLLPVGTPPNAIVFSTGYLTIPDMVKAGLVINIGSVLILQMALNSFIVPVFDLHMFPSAFQNLVNASTTQATYTLAANVTGAVFNVTSPLNVTGGIQYNTSAT